MELLESDDPKSELLKKSARHRQQLESDVALISARTEKVLTNALIIGGSLAFTYFLVRQFSGSKKKKKVSVRPRKVKIVQQDDTAGASEEQVSSSPGILTQVGTALAGQASAILLSLAKEKLMEFLQSQAEKKAQGHERS